MKYIKTIDMKKFNYSFIILFTFSTCIFISCEKDFSDDWLTSRFKEYTIPELYDLIGLDQYGCNDTLDCQGKYVYVTGYIIGINVFPDESRLLLYSEKSLNISEVFNLKLVDVKVEESDSHDFFSKIEDNYSELEDTTWREVKIKAEINGWTMYGNGWCQKAVGLIGHKIHIKD
jgi:hypothetical protein